MAEQLLIQPPARFEEGAYKAFHRELNARLQQIAQVLERLQAKPKFKGQLDAGNNRLTNIGKAVAEDDALPLWQLREEFEQLRRELKDELTSEAEDEGSETDSDTSTDEDGVSDDVYALLESAEPINPPPNVAAVSSIGTTTAAGTGDVARFALEDHTHGGILGAPPAGGVVNQVAFFTSTFTIGGDTTFLFDAASDVLNVGGQVVVGALAAPTNASVGLEILSTTKALLLSRLTTTQKNALTGVDGMLAYDTTLAKLQMRESSLWRTPLVLEGRTGTTNDPLINSDVGGTGFISGSTGVAGNLDLQHSTTLDYNNAGSGFIRLHGRIRNSDSWTATQVAGAILSYTPTIDITVDGAAPILLRFQPTMTTALTAAGAGAGGGGACLMMDAAGSITKTSAGSDAVNSNCKYQAIETRYLWQYNNAAAGGTQLVGGYQAAHGLRNLGAGACTVDTFYGFCYTPFTGSTNPDAGGTRPPNINPVGTGVTVTRFPVYWCPDINWTGSVGEFMQFYGENQVDLGTVRTSCLRSRMTSGTNKWMIYADGGANSFVQGLTTFASTLPAVIGPTATVDIFGDINTRHTSVALVNGVNAAVSRGTPARSAILITGPTAAFTIAGIAGGQNGMRLVIMNSTAQIMTINNQDALNEATAENRIICPGGVNFVGNALGLDAVELIYDATTVRWRVIDR